MISRVILYGQATMTYHYISINQLNVIIMNWTVFCTQVIKLLTKIANKDNVATKDDIKAINDKLDEINGKLTPKS